ITVSAAGLALENATIPPGADGALVVLPRPTASSPAALTRWRGRADDGQEQAVSIRGHPLERLQPWLATELPAAPTTAKAAEFQIDWRSASPDAKLYLGGKLPLRVKLTRADMNSVVRLTLLTSQLLPLVNNQPDVNATLRAEKPVELAAKVVEGEL